MKKKANSNCYKNKFKKINLKKKVNNYFLNLSYFSEDCDFSGDLRL